MGSEKGTQEHVENHKGLGEVKIASDVVAAIAGLAANEVDGVYSTWGNGKKEVIGKLVAKNASKGVRVTMEEDNVRVDMHITMKYGHSIPEVVEQVQERVSQQIETMTGLHVPEVNIRIAGVSLSEE